MKFIKIVLIPAALAILLYVGYRMVSSNNEIISPLPEDGIKVIQISPENK